MWKRIGSLFYMTHRRMQGAKKASWQACMVTYQPAVSEVSIQSLGPCFTKVIQARKIPVTFLAHRWALGFLLSSSCLIIAFRCYYKEVHVIWSSFLFQSGTKFIQSWHPFAFHVIQGTRWPHCSGSIFLYNPNPYLARATSKANSAECFCGWQ